MTEEEKEPRLFPVPREKIILKYLKDFSLPQDQLEFMISLLEGKTNENILICCHSDCYVCNDKIYECLQKLKKELGIV